MNDMAPVNPFHKGELHAQAKTGAGDVAKWAGGFVRDYLPEQHREFHTAQPFLVVAGGDEDGQTWITLLDGPDGFATSPDPRRITLNTTLEASDPLAAPFAAGADIGVLGIELASRRRNRFSAHVTPNASGYNLDVHQTFGNCPQYIHERSWSRVAKAEPVQSQKRPDLSSDQIALIGTADTMFIGSGHFDKSEAASNGYDASHRGGTPGFVHVVDSTHLQIPDYAGNNFFNTIGNIVSDPRIGLVFVDFETGGLLHITGRGAIDWDPSGAHVPDAQRLINVEIDAVISRPEAVGLRWTTKNHLSRRLRLARREDETTHITSFYFEPLDQQPLASFKAGQHLPIEVQIPGQIGTSKRSYSLSGAPENRQHYRLSVKREAQGLVSCFLHNELSVGSVIETSGPSGEFVIPSSTCPLVLVSAGVGLTPMVSMLHESADTNRPVWYVHGAINSQEHALRDEVDALVTAYDNLQKRIFYSNPIESDVLGRDYDMTGRITASDLLNLDAGPEAHYMLCGPAPFLSAIREGLEKRGVPADKIHLETFGPTA
ncbi:MAG: pyridoxamine 5'-phosphate oxidase family protein [Hyphomicrobiales bacterium]